MAADWGRGDTGPGLCGLGADRSRAEDSNRDGGRLLQGRTKEKNMEAGGRSGRAKPRRCGCKVRDDGRAVA